MESMELDLRQRNALGEMSNISMGSSATALSALLMNRRVEITTPQDVYKRQENNRSVCEAGAVIFLCDCILLRNQVQRLLSIS